MSPDTRNTARVSRRNIEVVRRSFEHFEAADMDAWTAQWNPDIVFDVSGYEHWDGEKKVYRGATEILEFFGAFMGGVKVLRVNVHDLREVGEDRVVAIYTETRRGPDDPEPFDVPIGIVYTLEDERFAHVEVHSSHEGALRSAGVR
jgi:ketosteroid isomerase-like protein